MESRLKGPQTKLDLINHLSCPEYKAAFGNFDLALKAEGVAPPKTKNFGMKNMHMEALHS